MASIEIDGIKLEAEPGSVCVQFASFSNASPKKFQLYCVRVRVVKRSIMDSNGHSPPKLWACASTGLGPNGTFPSRLRVAEMIQVMELIIHIMP